MNLPAPPRKILIVEDQEEVLRLLEVTLEDPERYQLMTARDGHRALQLARSEYPDIVFLDIRLPGIDGLEVCRQLKSDPRTWHARIVMVTALAQASDRERGLEAGADAYFTKPYSPVELMRLLDELLWGSE